MTRMPNAHTATYSWWLPTIAKVIHVVPNNLGNFYKHGHHHPHNVHPDYFMAEYMNPISP